MNGAPLIYDQFGKRTTISFPRAFDSSFFLMELRTHFLAIPAQ